MNFLIIILVFIGCLIVGGKSPGTSFFALFLFGNIVQEKAKNGELIESGGKYYAIKYVKDKVE